MLAMDSPVSPFRAIDVLSSDDERAIPESDGWERVENDFENGDPFPLQLDGFDDLEMRDDTDVSIDGANLGAPVPIRESVEFSGEATSSTVSSVEWNQMIAASFGQYRARHSDLAFPWESGVMADIFGTGSSVSLPQCVGIGEQLSLASVSKNLSASGDRNIDHLPHEAKYMSAVQSLKDVPYFEDKAHKLELACGYWMDILSIDWASSEVGAHLSAALLEDSAGGEAVSVLRSCFGVKSPSTLLKRANSFRQYIQWHKRSGYGTLNNCQPLPLEEKAVWEYFRYLKCLREANSRGYTVPSSFLETIRFCKFTLGLKQTEPILESRRLLGFAALEKRDKGPSHQVPGLEIEHVKRLHCILREADNDIDRLGAGCFLICIYSRARWSDVRFIDHVEITEGRFGSMTLFTTEHKTASVGLRREQYLPLIVPLEGIVNDDWIKLFQDVYLKCGLDLTRRPLGPLLPAPKLTGQFCARPLTTSEAACWLRALLGGMDGVAGVRSHSMKSTVLIWVARAGFDKETRAVLGHHSSALQGSDVVYSRVLQTRALRKLAMLLRRIRIGLDIEDEHMKEFGILQTPAAMTPAPRTPGILAPMAPTVESEATAKIVHPESSALDDALEVAQELEDLQSVKEEMLTVEDIEKEAVNVSLFPLDVVQKGLVEIESSSGSSSDSSSDNLSEDEERAPPKFSHPRYSEDVPADRDFYRHNKSGILHSCETGKRVAVCKVTINANYKLMNRTMQIRYAKCIRCFPKNNNRVRSVDDMVQALDSAVKRSCR